jgi:hypothetical protein
MSEAEQQGFVGAKKDWRPSEFYSVTGAQYDGPPSRKPDRRFQGFIGEQKDSMPNEFYSVASSGGGSDPAEQGFRGRKRDWRPNEVYTAGAEHLRRDDSYRPDQWRRTEYEAWQRRNGLVVDPEEEW